MGELLTIRAAKTSGAKGGRERERGGVKLTVLSITPCKLSETPSRLWGGTVC